MNNIQAPDCSLHPARKLTYPNNEKIKIKRVKEIVFEKLSCREIFFMITNLEIPIIFINNIGRMTINPSKKSIGVILLDKKLLRSGPKIAL